MSLNQANQEKQVQEEHQALHLIIKPLGFSQT